MSSSSSDSDSDEEKVKPMTTYTVEYFLKKT